MKVKDGRTLPSSQKKHLHCIFSSQKELQSLNVYHFWLFNTLSLRVTILETLTPGGKLSGISQTLSHRLTISTKKSLYEAKRPTTFYASITNSDNSFLQKTKATFLPWWRKSRATIVLKSLLVVKRRPALLTLNSFKRVRISNKNFELPADILMISPSHFISSLIVSQQIPEQ